MQKIEIKARNTVCKGCKATVTRSHADEHKWLEVVEVENDGTQYDRYKLCPYCAKNWIGIDEKYTAYTARIPSV